MYYKHKYANVFYEKYGSSSSTILILPGWGDTRNTFSFLLEYFKDSFTIYIFDYPGFGNSPPIHKVLTIEDYAMIIKDFMEQESIHNPIIIAHSFGGRITAILSGRYQIPIPKMVLMDVAGIKRRNPSLLLKTYLYKFLKRLCNFFHKPSWLRRIRKCFSSYDYQNVPPFMASTFQNVVREDLKDDYKKIHSDVLIFWGEKDQDTPLKDAYYLHQNINGSGLVLYPKAGHFSYLENPFLTLQILDIFFTKKDMD